MRSSNELGKTAVSLRQIPSPRVLTRYQSKIGYGAAPDLEFDASQSSTTLVNQLTKYTKLSWKQNWNLETDSQ